MERFYEKYIIREGTKVDLSKFDPDDTLEFKDKAAGLALLEKNNHRIARLQTDLYSEGKQSLLIVLQALDAGGKDGTINNVFSAMNPQGCRVQSFKTPTALEQAHDFLWRAHPVVPRRGEVVIFNRSYYEECLVVRVHGLWRDYQLPRRCTDMSEKRYFEERYEDIRGFERYLWRTGNRVVKIFLNVSADKQRERFLERIDDEAKNWKFSESDLAERMEWDEYQRAYEEMINGTATRRAPWLVIPADQKWVARTLVSEALLRVLEDMDPRYPELPRTSLDRLDECRAALVDGPAADVDD